jgi:hypothetical protein
MTCPNSFENRLRRNDANVDQDRSARNQAVFRAGNEAIRANARGADALLLLCECPDEACLDRIVVKAAEYEEVRTAPHRFIVAVGHDVNVPEDAVVIDETERFLVFERLEAHSFAE